MFHFDIAVIGGDLRLAYMIPFLVERGYSVVCYGTQTIPDEGQSAISCYHAGSLGEAVERADVIVGGIPFCKGDCIYANRKLTDLKLSSLYKLLKGQQKLIAGVIPEKTVAFCKKQEIECYDFMKDEPLAVFNAIATAEGSILEALSCQGTNIHGSSALVLGYGRCARILADKLKGLSAKVTIAARDEIQRANAQAMGLETLSLDELEKKIGKFEYIFNTIPAVVLYEAVLKCTHPDAVVIDIASGAGGVDYKAAKEYGVHALLCLGLPGKYAPKISAKGMADFVIRTCFETK